MRVFAVGGGDLLEECDRVVLVVRCVVVDVPVDDDVHASFDGRLDDLKLAFCG